MSVNKFLRSPGRFPPACLVLVTAAVVLGGPASAQAAPPMTITVHVDQPAGAANRLLRGFNWNTAALDGVAPLAPARVRIDARLEDASTGPNALDLTDLLARVATVRSIGAEPIVILSYMPAWLGGPNANGRDPTKVPPASGAQWKALIKTVVHTLATAPAPALRFEVWNEPDSPAFWQDLPTAFVDLAVLTHTAVAEVAGETGLPLQIGGPAAIAPDPFIVVPYVNAMKSNGLPLDFISWHYYGNTPFFGPDGAENILPPYLLPAYVVLGQQNPLATPTIYSDQVEFMRSLRDALVSGSVLHPTLAIDEWNLSGGGYDNRHDTNDGAAFAAAVLIEMEHASLDAANFYKAASTIDPAHTGDWGVVDAAGERKPVWSVFDAFNRAGTTRLTTDGDDPLGGVWSRASTDGHAINVLLASWDARGGSERAVDVVVPATCGEVRVIDATSPSFDAVSPAAVANGHLALTLPAQSVTWLSISDACRSAGGSVGTDATNGAALAVTGGDDVTWTATALVALALLVRRCARAAP